MTSKVLKGFSISAFCLPFAGILFLILGWYSVGISEIDSFFFILCMITPFVGVPLAFIELVQGHKNRIKGEKGGIKGLSIAALVMNTLNLIIALFFILILISDAIDNHKYKKARYIPKVEKQYQGVYLPEDLYKTITNKKSYVQYFREKNQNVYFFYFVKEHCIEKIGNGIDDGDALLKEEAEKFSFTEKDGLFLLTKDDGEVYIKVAEEYEGQEKLLFDLYLKDYEKFLPDYNFLIYPWDSIFIVNSDPDFIVYKYEENDGLEEFYYSVKLKGDTLELRPLVEEKIDESEEPNEFFECGCGEGYCRYREDIDSVKVIELTEKQQKSDAVIK